MRQYKIWVQRPIDIKKKQNWRAFVFVPFHPKLNNNTQMIACISKHTRQEFLYSASWPYVDAI